MKKRTELITVTQMFVMLFVSQILLNLTYNPLMSHTNENMWDQIISIIISFFVIMIICVPSYFFHKENPQTNIAEKFTKCFGKFGIILSLIYVIYYLFVNCYSMCVFNIFISNVMNPNTSLWAISIVVGLCSWYGANKGIEGLARASWIILFMILLPMIFLFCALFPGIDNLNYTSFMQNGSENVVNGTVAMVAQNFPISTIVMISPYVNGNIKKGLFFWNLLSHLFLASTIALVIGNLGDYAKTQMFPVYTAATIAEIGNLKRLDSIFLGLWTTSLFCKISMFLFLISNTFKSILGKKAAKISLILSSIFITIFSGTSSYNIEFLKFMYNPFFVLSFTGLVSFFLPSLALVLNKQKSSKSSLDKI